jgi:hypothetical protein
LRPVARRQQRPPANDEPQRFDRVVGHEAGADQLAQRVAKIPRRQRASGEQLVEERRAIAFEYAEDARCVFAEWGRIGG